MKKIILFFLIIIFLSGCTTVENLSYDEIINNILEKDINLENQYRNGYKYYAPRGVNVLNKTDYNEKLKDQRNTYYLYIDLISYYNNKQVDFKNQENVFYNKEINHDDKYGYINISLTNDKYLIEMMYNYAKIEVIVDEKDLNITIHKAITILSSIKYNKTLIEELVKSDQFVFTEKEINIFATKENNESNMLKYEEEYGKYKEDELPDLDIIE